MVGDESLGLPWVVVLGFLRIATNPKIFPKPLLPPVAMAKIDTWFAQPNICLLSEKKNHWEILKGLMVECGMAGNLTTDAHLAAIAISYGATLASCDADFGRFRGLRWENPRA